MMELRLTEDEVQEIDSMMNNHMYHHTISNNVGSWTCNHQCRMQALGDSINKVLEKKTDVVVLEPEIYKKLTALVRESEGIMPVSVESLVHMALDAFTDGANGT